MELTVLRHSTARKIDDTSYRADIENRDLTEEGIALALRRKKMLDNPSFDLIVSSPALRTVQTAGIVAGLGRDNITDVVPLEMLCYGNPADGGDAKTLDQLFRKLEYSPLADYLSKGKDGEVISRAGLAAWQAVRNFAGRARADRVLAVGHAVLINALGYEAVKQSDHRRIMADTSFGECEGFTLEFDKNFDATKLQLIQ